MVCNTIKKAVMISPSGIRIELKGTSEDFILDREKRILTWLKKLLIRGLAFLVKLRLHLFKKKVKYMNVLLPIKHSLPGSLFWQTGWNQDWPGS
jgi:hypothetical protein